MNCFPSPFSGRTSISSHSLSTTSGSAPKLSGGQDAILDISSCFRFDRFVSVIGCDTLMLVQCWKHWIFNTVWEWSVVGSFQTWIESFISVVKHATRSIGIDPSEEPGETTSTIVSKFRPQANRVIETAVNSITEIPRVRGSGFSQHMPNVSQSNFHLQ